MPQLEDIIQHKNGYNSRKKTDVGVKFGVVVAETFAQHILWALML